MKTTQEIIVLAVEAQHVYLCPPNATQIIKIEKVDPKTLRGLHLVSFLGCSLIVHY